MPVKNEERYLDACLQSIECQSEKGWELIAIDDHSDDRSKEILELFATRDHRIKVHSNPGIGIVHALQFAYQKAKGE